MIVPGQVPCLGDTGEIFDDEPFPAGLRVHPCATERPFGGVRSPGPTSQCGPQGLTALGEGRVDGGKDL